MSKISQLGTSIKNTLFGTNPSTPLKPENPQDSPQTATNTQPKVSESTPDTPVSATNTESQGSPQTGTKPDKSPKNERKERRQKNYMEAQNRIQELQEQNEKSEKELAKIIQEKTILAEDVKSKYNRIKNIVKEIEEKKYKRDGIIKELFSKDGIDSDRPFYKKSYIYISLPAKIGLIIGFLLIVILLLIWAIVATTIKTKFENKNTNDPYGTGIRHYVSRDDSGAIPSSLEERQFGSKPLKIEPLTSSPEPPNFTKYYNIEANIKDGSVMIDRENFENIDISNDKLHNAIKGL